MSPALAIQQSPMLFHVFNVSLKGQGVGARASLKCIIGTKELVFAEELCRASEDYCYNLFCYSSYIKRLKFHFLYSAYGCCYMLPNIYPF